MALNRGSPAILWGDGLENTLEFGLPLAGAVTSRPELPGYEAVQSPTGSEDAWVPGRGEYQLDAELGWVELRGRTSPYTHAGWSGPTGVQSFLQWARDKRRFRFVPDKTVPDFWVDDCYLVNPIDDEPPRERDGNRRLPVSVRSGHMDFGWALRGVGVDFGPGTDLLDWPRGYFDRQATDGRFHTMLGAVGTVVGNVIRDRHYDAARRVVLFEPSVTNYLLQSQAWATAPWGNNVVTATNNFAAGPDGTTTATKLLPNNVAANNPYVVQGNIAIVSGENVALSVYVKANGYSAIVLRAGNDVSTNGFQRSFDLATGTFGTINAGFGAGVIHGSDVEALADGWYRVSIWGAINGGVTAASVFCYVYPNIATANGQTSYIADGTSSVLGWGAQFERGTTAVKVVPGLYVPTTTTALSKQPDTLTWYAPWVVQPSWMYLKFIELGAATRGSFDNLVRWGELAGAVPQVRVLTGSGTPGANPFWRFNWSHDGGTTQSAGIANVTPAVGDVVELYGRLFANGNVELHQSINGAAPAVFAGSGGQSLAGKVIAKRLQLGESAAAGLVRFKLGFAPRVTTLAQGRVA